MGDFSEYYHRSSLGSVPSVELYRSMLSVTPDAACICDADGSLVLANDAFTALSGGTESDSAPEHASSGPLRLVRESDGEAVALTELLGRGSSDKAYIGRGYSLLLLSGAELPVELRAARLGKEFRLCIFRDLTRERRESTALAAVESRHSTDKRLTGLGHDINNALTALRGAVELLQDDSSLSDDARLQLSRMSEAISDAESAGTELAWLNDDSLAARRSGVWEIDELLRHATRSAVRGSEVGCEISSSAPAAYSIIPAERFEQLVRALVENAADALGHGGIVRVRASLMERGYASRAKEQVLIAEPGQMLLQISVRDSGDGIAEADRSHIFEPYFSTKAHSAGLGLTVARQTLTEFGGGLSIESSPGEGTVATAYVPVYGVGHRPVQGVHSASDASRLRILVMDDNELVRSTLRDMLSRLGYRVTVTADGSEAVYIYEKALEAGSPFDVCILDSVVAGGLSGEEAMQRIAHRNSKACGVLLHAAERRRPGVQNEAAQSLFQATLYKPFGIQAVSDAIAHVLAEHPH